MSKLEESSVITNFQIPERIESFSQEERTLRSEVEKALHRYFQYVDDEPVTDLHQMVMSEVEGPLLETIMQRTGNNQSKASIMLGLNRGTLRTKLKHYGLL
ncbi:MAG: DNA-binding transcriptional regulator Fis [Gammaproteobacteria bacterium]|nr:DNA-binding transcriptional regulator Fis [Gammaproteobacteria bacterium]